MSVTAKQLSQSGARGKDLDGVIREQLKVIDDKLQRADRTWGRNVVSHGLPTGITLPGLDKKDAQRIVYSSILRSLDKRGFETALLLEDEATVLYVAWMTDLDVEEVEAMNALLRSKRVRRQDVPDFVQKGTMAAPRAASAARQGRAPPAAPLTVTGADRTMRPRGGAAQARPAEPAADQAGASSAEAAILAAAGGL